MAEGADIAGSQCTETGGALPPFCTTPPVSEDKFMRILRRFKVSEKFAPRELVLWHRLAAAAHKTAEIASLSFSCMRPLVTVTCKRCNARVCASSNCK